MLSQHNWYIIRFCHVIRERRRQQRALISSYIYIYRVSLFIPLFVSSDGPLACCWAVRMRCRRRSRRNRWSDDAGPTEAIRSVALGLDDGPRRGTSLGIWNVKILQAACASWADHWVYSFFFFFLNLNLQDHQDHCFIHRFIFRSQSTSCDFMRLHATFSTRVIFHRRRSSDRSNGRGSTTELERACSGPGDVRSRGRGLELRTDLGREPLGIAGKPDSDALVEWVGEFFPINKRACRERKACRVRP